MYQALVFIHILGGVVWLGGGIFATFMTNRALSSGEDRDIARFMDTLEPVGGRIFGIAPPVTILAGVGLVAWSSAWRFSHPWVYGSLGLIVVTAVFGGVLSARLGRDARTAVEDHGAGSDEFGAAVRKWSLYGNIDLAAILAILVLMVFKPGV